MNFSHKLVLFFTSMLIGFSAKALQCNELSNVSEPIDSRSLSSRVKADNLRSIIERVLSGAVATSAIKATPEYEYLTFSVRSSSSRGWDRFKGRILEVRRNANGTLDLIFLNRLNDPKKPEAFIEVEDMILLSALDLRSLVVTKDLTKSEYAEVESLVRKASAENKLIRFETVNGSSRYVGRVEDQYKGNFTLSTSKRDFDFTIDEVDPYSIEIFSPPTWQEALSPGVFLNELMNAKKMHTYVSFKYATSYGERVFEGWITAIETIENGDTNLILDRNWGGAKRNDLRVLLSSVTQWGYTVRPKNSTERPTGQILDQIAAPRISIYVSEIDGSQTQEVKVSSEFLDQLEVFSDKAAVSGKKLPAELSEILTSGKEVRIYFAVSFLAIRLTIRHKKGGGVSFGSGGLSIGSTEDDVDFANEGSWQDGVWVDFEKNGRVSYNRHELAQLMTTEGYSTGSILRTRLRSIRSRFVHKYLQTKRPDLFTKLQGAFPENFSDDSLAETALFLNGMKFSLSRGIVKISPHSAIPAYAKFASAVKFVLDNDKVFYSSNAIKSGIEHGIYDRRAIAKPVSTNSAPFEFASSLFEAMAKLGMRFDEAAMNWVPK